MSYTPSYFIRNRLWKRAVKIRAFMCIFPCPPGNTWLLVLLIVLRSIIFNDNSSSRIRFKFYKYILKFIFATFRVLEKKKRVSRCCPAFWRFTLSLRARNPIPTRSHLFHFKMHGSLLPGLGALDVEFHTHVFQPIFYVFNKTVKTMKTHKPEFLPLKHHPKLSNPSRLQYLTCCLLPRLVISP